MTGRFDLLTTYEPTSLQKNILFRLFLSISFLSNCAVRKYRTLAEPVETHSVVTWLNRAQTPKSSWLGEVVRSVPQRRCTSFALDIPPQTSPSSMYTRSHHCNLQDMISTRLWVFGCAMGRTCSFRWNPSICGKTTSCLSLSSTKWAW